MHCTTRSFSLWHGHQPFVATRQSPISRRSPVFCVWVKNATYTLEAGVLWEEAWDTDKRLMNAIMERAPWRAVLTCMQLKPEEHREIRQVRNLCGILVRSSIPRALCLGCRCPAPCSCVPTSNPLSGTSLGQEPEL